MANIKNNNTWVVVVAQLAERAPPIPEVCGSNTVISKFYTYLLSTALKRRK